MSDENTDSVTTTQTTPNLGELFAAMAMARQEFGTLTKSKNASIRSDKGASYSYSYADLNDLIEATAAALAKHGLVIIQEPEVISDNGRQMVVINGCIAHKSGGVYQLRPLPLAVAGNTAQAVGSAISYARRYQLSAVLNLAAADDDGNEASNGQAGIRSSRAAQAVRPPNAQRTQDGTVTHRRQVDANAGEITSPSAAADPANDVDFGMGNGSANDPTEDESAILSVWSSPEDAQVWAVNTGACQNAYEARNSFKKIVDKHGGKLNKGNLPMVLLDFLRRQNEKLEQQPQAA